MTSSSPTPGVPSPCVNVCQMDATTGWCEGCLRRIDEIAGWSQFSDARKQAVWDELPRRLGEWQRLGKPRPVSAG